jgi:hypothetical protein
MQSMLRMAVMIPKSRYGVASGSAHLHSCHERVNWSGRDDQRIA